MTNVTNTQVKSETKRQLALPKVSTSLKAGLGSFAAAIKL
jgi:hypothetical protein